MVLRQNNQSFENQSGYTDQNTRREHFIRRCFPRSPNRLLLPRRPTKLLVPHLGSCGGSYRRSTRRTFFLLSNLVLVRYNPCTIQRREELGEFPLIRKGGWIETPKGLAPRRRRVRFEQGKYNKSRGISHARVVVGVVP